MLFIAVFAAASMVAVAQRAVPTGTFRESGSEGSVEVGIVTVGTAAAGLSSVFNERVIKKYNALK